MKYLVISILLLGFLVPSYSQSTGSLTVEQAVAEALKNNPAIKASAYEVESKRRLQKTSFDLPKTEVMLLYGQYNSYAKNDNNITVSQTIPFSALGSQRTLNRAVVNAAEVKKEVTENDLVYQVKQVYHHLAFLKARRNLLLRQDSIYEGFLKSALLRYKTGETNLLEQTTAESQRNEAKNQIVQIDAAIYSSRRQLQTLMNVAVMPEILDTTLTPLLLDVVPDTVSYKSNPSLQYMQQQVAVAQGEQRIQSAKFAPDLHIGFFSQTLIGSLDAENGHTSTLSDRFTGFQVGISLPLWFTPHLGRVQAAAFNKRVAESNYEAQQRTLQGQLQQAIQQVQTNRASLAYYVESALPNSDLILKQAQTAFREGEIGYAEYLLGIRNAITIRENYINTLNEYNQSVIYVEYLTGNK